jgi:NAD(P)-dependent dehydrogenase (short-subunit alcohol dehydrogenase family)
MQIDGIGAIITGAASGLGRATAGRLVERGANVLLLDRDESGLSRAVSELGPSARSSVVDVTDFDGVRAAIEDFASTEVVRVVVNCAGIGIAKRVIDRAGEPHDLASFRRIIDVNLIGTFNVMAIGASVISKSEPLELEERGVIINTASIAAYDGQIGQLAYSASKGGIVGMTLPAARDLSAVGIRVMTIAPGIVDTPLLGQLPDSVREALAKGVPFPKRLGVPTDYAQLAIAIVENGYLNGEVIRMDGSLRMAPK